EATEDRQREHARRARRHVGAERRLAEGEHVPVRRRPAELLLEQIGLAVPAAARARGDARHGRRRRGHGRHAGRHADARGAAAIAGRDRGGAAAAVVAPGAVVVGEPDGASTSGEERESDGDEERRAVRHGARFSGRAAAIVAARGAGWSHEHDRVATGEGGVAVILARYMAPKHLAWLRAGLAAALVPVVAACAPPVDGAASDHAADDDEPGEAAAPIVNGSV